jgi:N-acetylneuraminic acid mutarotase
VLVFGGVDAQNKAVTTVEAFDPDSETFQVVATGLPDIQDFSATLLDDGEILIAGGSNGEWNGMTAATWLLKP